MTVKELYNKYYNDRNMSRFHNIASDYYSKKLNPKDTIPVIFDYYEASTYAGASPFNNRTYDILEIIDIVKIVEYANYLKSKKDIRRIL